MSAAEGTDPAAPQASRRARAYPGAWLRLLRSELGIIGGRRRNQMGLLVLAALPVIMAVAIKVNNRNRRGGAGGGLDLLSSVTSNGLFLAFVALSVEIGLFLPIAVACLSADAVAGEASGGTLRYLLTVPVTRTRTLAVKAVAVAFGSLGGVAIVALAGIVAGVALFGTGPLTTLSGDQISLAEALGRLGIAVLYVAAGTAALGMVGLFVSTLTEQPIAAIIATTFFSTLSWILDTVPQVDWLHPWLLVDRWPAFTDLLREPVYWPTMLAGLAVDLGYAAVFWLAAWARFGGKDITS